MSLRTAIAAFAFVLPFVVVAGQNSDYAKSADAQGLVLMQSGDFTGAASKFREAVHSEPQSPGVHYNLALALVRLHKNDEAIQELRTTLILRPQFDAALYNLGVLLEQSGRFREAVENFQIYRELKPDDPTALVHLVQDDFKAGEEGKGLTLAREGLTQYSDLRVSTQLAIVILEYGHYAESIPFLERAHEAARGSAPLLVYLARAYLGAGKLDLAMSLLEQGIGQFPASVDLYLMMGIAEAERHGAAAAKPYITRGIELGPEIPLGYNLLGNLDLRVGNYEEALRNYKKAEELAPENGLYHYDVALVLERMDRVAEAISFAEQSIRLNPDRDASHYLLGKLYSKSGRQAEAIRELQACVRLNPQADAPYYLLARTYKQLGRQETAEEWIRKLSQLKQEKNGRIGLMGPASESSDIRNAPMPWDRIR